MSLCSSAVAVQSLTVQTQQPLHNHTEVAGLHQQSQTQATFRASTRAPQQHRFRKRTCLACKYCCRTWEPATQQYSNSKTAGYSQSSDSIPNNNATCLGGYTWRNVASSTAGNHPVSAHSTLTSGQHTCRCNLLRNAVAPAHLNLQS